MAAGGGEAGGIAQLQRRSLPERPAVFEKRLERGVGEAGQHQQHAQVLAQALVQAPVDQWDQQQVELLVAEEGEDRHWQPQPAAEALERGVAADVPQHPTEDQGDKQGDEQGADSDDAQSRGLLHGGPPRFEWLMSGPDSTAFCRTWQDCAWCVMAVPKPAWRSHQPLLELLRIGRQCLYVLAFSANQAATFSVKLILPNAGDQPIACLLHVSAIAGKLLGQYLLLIQDACHQNRYDEQRGQQCPP